MKETLENLTEHCRYSEDLDTLIVSLGGYKKVLRLDYDSDYSGYVDVDLELNNGVVFSYKYWYGSCSGCDKWEDELGSDHAQVVEVMRKEATYFDNMEQYTAWRNMVAKRQEERDKINAARQVASTAEEKLKALQLKAAFNGDTYVLRDLLKGR